MPHLDKTVRGSSRCCATISAKPAGIATARAASSAIIVVVHPRAIFRHDGTIRNDPAYSVARRVTFQLVHHPMPYGMLLFPGVNAANLGRYTRTRASADVRGEGKRGSSRGAGARRARGFG